MEFCIDRPEPNQADYDSNIGMYLFTVMGRDPFASIISLDILFQLKAEQINKMTTIFTQNDHFFKPDQID